MHTTDCIQEGSHRGPRSTASKEISKCRAGFWHFSSGSESLESGGLGPPIPALEIYSAMKWETLRATLQVWSQVQTGNFLEVQLLRLHASTGRHRFDPWLGN